MKHLRHAKNLRGFNHRAGEHGKTLGVIGIIAHRSSIERLAIEVRGILHEVVTNAAVSAPGHDTAKTILVVVGDGDTSHHSLRVSELCLAITWQIHADLMALGR